MTKLNREMNTDSLTLSSVSGTEIVSLQSTSSGKDETIPLSKYSQEQYKKVVVVGGGPVGLMFALLLSEYSSRKKICFDIHIYEQRWKIVDGRVVWKDEKDGNNRRKQVVTIQSNVWSLFPSHVKKALFGADESDEFMEMWPLGPDSPKIIGYPRNIPVEVLEDKLLNLLQTEPNIRDALDCFEKEQAKPTLHCHRVGSEKAMKDILDMGVDYLVLADGGASKAERFLNEALVHGKFLKKPAPLSNFKLFKEKTAFNQDPELKKQDMVLGIQLKAESGEQLYEVSMSESMAITISQNVLLLNPLGKRSGFLNFWLTEDESKDAYGITGQGGYASCNQSSPCHFAKDSDGEFKCATHKSVFAPSKHRDGKLWKKITNALQLYGIHEDRVRSFTKFQLGPYAERQQFSAEAELYNGTKLWSFLIGDAAMTVNFRAGRGLNTGLKGAISLARALTLADFDGDTRPARFVNHEGMMFKLQKREVEIRSLGMMATGGKEGTRDDFKERLKSSSKVFTRDRLPESVEEPKEEKFLKAVDRVPIGDDGFVVDLFNSGGWKTGPVGGPEVGQDTEEPLWDDYNTTMYAAQILGDTELMKRLDPKFIFHNYKEELCDSFLAARFAISQLAKGVNESELGEVLDKKDRPKWNSLTKKKRDFIDDVYTFTLELKARLNIVKNRLEGKGGSETGSTLQDCYKGFDREKVIKKIDSLKQKTVALRDEFNNFRLYLEEKYKSREKWAKIIRNCTMVAGAIAVIAAVVVTVAVPASAPATAVAAKFAVEALAAGLVAGGSALVLVAAGAAVALSTDQTKKAIEYLKDIDNRMGKLRSSLTSVRACVAPLDMVTRNECVVHIASIIKECDALANCCYNA